MVRLSRPKYAKVIIRNWENVCWKNTYLNQNYTKCHSYKSTKEKRRIVVFTIPTKKYIENIRISQSLIEI